MIPREVLDEILQRTDIVALISDYLPLKKSGRNYKGLCPFHQEKTPSFMVHPEKQIFHCFGCSQGGNAYGFLMKIENLSFPEALERLSRKAGIDLSPYKKSRDQPKEERDVYYRINQYAAWFFAENLRTQEGMAQRGGDYLQSRGINQQTESEFQLGVSLDQWDALVRFFDSKKVPLETAEKLGLVRRRSDGSFYDFFRNRLMFPIMDLDGRVIGFGARRLDDTHQSDEAKYINSPESPIYHKGQTIYGLYQARNTIRQKDQVILVEGNLDVLSLHQAGMKNAVAPLGTALTPSQVHFLKRLSRQVVLMFDGDDAGRLASERAILTSFEAGLHPRVVCLPEKDDPDSLIRREGVDPMNEKIRQAPGAMEGLFLEHLGRIGSQVSQKIQAARRLLPFIKALPDELEQKTYESRLFSFLGIDERKVKGPSSKTQTADQDVSKVSSPPKISLERIILALYVREPHRVDPLIREEIFQEFENTELRELGLRIKQHFSQHGCLSLEMLTDPNHEDETNLASELLMETETFSENVEQEVLASLEKWKHRRFQEELKNLTQQIQIAELKGDKENLGELLTRKNRKIAELHLK